MATRPRTTATVPSRPKNRTGARLPTARGKAPAACYDHHDVSCAQGAARGQREPQNTAQDGPATPAPAWGATDWSCLPAVRNRFDPRCRVGSDNGS